MTATTVTGTVARRQKADQLVSWLRGQQDELAMAAASHIKPSTLVRVTQGALRKDDKLMQAAIANPLSLLNCLLDAARLGHEPGTDQYYLVPFGSEVTGIEGYKGIIERMYRAGGVSSVVAQTVRQRDRYASRGENTPPVHEYDEFASPDQRGPLRGAYAYAIFGNGHCSQVIRMGRAEIMEHKAASRGADRADSPWQRWEPAMWKKTVLRALEPYVPTSSEWLNARAQAAAQAAQPHPNGLTPPLVPSEPIVDAEIVHEPSGPAVQDSHVERADPAAGPETQAPAARDDTTSGTRHAAAVGNRAEGPAAPAGEGGRTSADPRAAGATSARGAQPPAPQVPQPAPKGMVLKLDRLLGQLQLGPDADVKALQEWLCGGPWAATRGQVQLVTTWLEDHLQACQGDTAEAFEAIWAQYRAARALDAAEAGDAGEGGHDGS